MAEFTEVMRQAKRMCESCKQSCEKCAFNTTGESSILFPLVDHTGEHIPMDWNLDKLSEIERIVMRWAAEHPEPRYPTWYGMWKQLFPTAECVPCIKVAIGNEYQPKEGCDAIRCDVCKMRRIPADIAKNLNIQPIEPIEWEEEE